LDAPALAARMTASGKAAAAVVAASNLAVDRIDVVYELDMHYIGQTHTVGVPITFAADADGNAVTRGSVAAAFESAYQQSFSRLLPGIPARIVNLRTAAIGRRPAFDLAALAPGADASRAKAARGQRPVWFDGAWHATEIWNRLDLPFGEVIAGPAILEQDDATIVVEPGLQARVDRLGNLIMERVT
jgi:N-methylhydantoinase A